MPALRVETAPDGIATVLYDVPGEPVNTLRESFQQDFDQVFARLSEDPAVTGIVLASAKQDSFVVGADVEMLARVKNATEATALARGGQQAMERLEELGKRKPVVAAIHGPALGGGLELALAATYRVATDDRKTQLGQPEVQLGLIPGAGGTQRLPRFIGKAKAMDLCLTGRMMDAAEAERLGLVSRVVPADKLRDEALAVAEKVASLSRPIAMMVKEAVNRAFETTLAEGVRFERRLFHATFATEDQKEGMAAFIAKRKPAFKNR
jgi:enoyl-CoA hydratase